MKVFRVTLSFLIALSAFAQPEPPHPPKADFNKFVRAADGEVIGVLSLGKTNLALTDTVKEITWTASGESITLRWNGDFLSGTRGTNHFWVKHGASFWMPEESYISAQTNIKPSAMIGIVTNSVAPTQETLDRLCASRGHQWQLGCGYGVGCLVIHPNPMRHCIVCGLSQTQEVGPWK